MDQIKVIEVIIQMLKASIQHYSVFFLLGKKTDKYLGGTPKERYYKSVCLLFGCAWVWMNKNIRDSKHFTGFIQTAVHFFNYSFSEEIKKSMFKGVKFDPGPKETYSNLNSEVCKWFAKNQNAHAVMAIIETGVHMMISTVNNNKIDKKTLEQHQKLGSLFEKNNQPIDGIRLVMENKSLKIHI